MRVKPGLTGSAGARRVFSESFNLVPEAASLVILLEAFTEENASLRLAFETASGARIFSVSVQGGSPKGVILDIGSLSGLSLQALSISLEVSGGAFDGFRVDGMYLSSTAFLADADRLLSPVFTASGAETKVNGEGLLVTLTDSAAEVTGYPVSGAMGSGFAVASITADSEAMVSFAYGAGETKTLSTSVTVAPGTYDYLFPVRLTDPMKEFTFSLTGQAGQTVVIRSLTLSIIDETVRSDTGLGSVSACSYHPSSGTLTVSGTINSLAVIQYIGGQLVLFRADESGTYDADHPLASADISTRFKFTETVPSSVIPESRFLLAIRDRNGIIHPVSEPLYAVGQNPASAGSTTLGLAGTTQADAFTANADTVIVDILLNRLLGGNGGTTGGKYCMWDGRIYTLNSDYLSELDTLIRFYEAAGISVYFRYLSNEDLSVISLTLPSRETAPYYALNASDEEGIRLLSAVTDFLTERYSGIAGIIVGASFDDLSLNSGDAGSMLSYVENYARALRRIYQITVTHQSSFRMLVPVGIREDGANGTLSLLSTLYSKLNDVGLLPVELLYYSAEADRMTADVDWLMRRLTAASCKYDGKTLLYQPVPSAQPEEVIRWFSVLYSEARGKRYATVFFDRSGASEDDLHTLLKTWWTVSSRRISSGTVTDTPPALKGSFPLWDFTESYDPAGWISGGGYSQPQTSSSSAFANHYGRHSCRVLRSVSTAAASGVLLSVFDSPMDLTSSPYVSITLLTNGAGVDSTVTIVFGARNTHEEFTATVRNGQTTALTCDLSGFSLLNGVEFVSVVLPDGIESLEISKIELGSISLSKDELQEKITPAAAKEDPFSANKTIILAIGLSLVFMTVGAVIILTRESLHKKK